MALSGLGWGLLLLGCLSTATVLSAWLIILNGQGGDFKNQAHAAFGVWGERRLEMLVVVFVFLGLVGYFVILRSALPPLIQWMAQLSAEQAASLWYCNPLFLTAMWAVAVLYPLCLLRQIRFLAFTSGLSKVRSW
jgi:sodium-coupled neutral amino acid transporter 2